MRKGFTLIELLAVILILGIIALIAIPTVNKVVKQAKEGAFKSSVENIVKKIEEECQTQLLKGETLTTSYTFNNGVVIPSLDVKGKLPLSGTILVDNDCKTAVNVSNGTLTFTKTKDGELTTSTNFFNTLKDKVDDLIDNSDTYEYMGGTYLKGMQDSNYLWYSGNLYRIMGYDENNNVRLISEGSITSIPYHSSSSTFSTSYLKDWLNTYFYNHIDNSILQDTSYCTDLTTDKSSARTTCTNKVTGTKVTSISLDEYRLSAEPIEYACNDVGLRYYQSYNDNAKTQTDFQNYLISQGDTCIEYLKSKIYFYGTKVTYNDSNEKVSISLSYIDDPNYITFYNSFSILTPYSSSRKWSTFGYGNDSGTIYADGVRPIITIPSNIAINKGNGDLTSPIIFEENKKSGRLIDNVKSGEYVTIEDKLYRVIDKVNGIGTKLALDGYLQNADTYTNVITGMGNNKYLTELGLSVDDSRLVNYTWDRGKNFYWGNNYTVSLSSSTNTFQSKVGGVRLGEMYSSQSNSIPIENRNWYWLLTPYGTSRAWRVRDDDFGDCDNASYLHLVRPAIMISSNTIINGGNGTLDSPYEI